MKISAQLAGLDPPVSFGAPHLQVERALHAKPVTWTPLRPTMFVQTLRMFAPDLARCLRLIAPMGRGAIAFVDARDVAAVAVAALLHRDLACPHSSPERSSRPSPAAKSPPCCRNGSGIAYATSRRR